MVIYLYFVILMIICAITGIITTIVEHKRLIPKKKKSKVRVLEAPKLVYQSIESHITKERDFIKIVDNKPRFTIENKKMAQIEVLDNNIEVLDEKVSRNIEELI